MPLPRIPQENGIQGVEMCIWRMKYFLLQGFHAGAAADGDGRLHGVHRQCDLPALYLREHVRTLSGVLRLDDRGLADSRLPVFHPAGGKKQSKEGRLC